MGLFGQSSPFDLEIEKATSEKNTTEPWGVIMDICDKVGSNPRNAKDCLKSIMKRLGHNDPHVVIQAITLLDACVNNCGKNFHLEVASREFENEFKRLLGKAQLPVASKMRLLLKKWAENDFKTDPQLNLIPSLYHKLKTEGADFSDNQKVATIKTPSSTAGTLKDANVVASQQEAEDIATAIELSLKETKTSPKKQVAARTSLYASLYPSFNDASELGDTIESSSPGPQPIELRKVRALYDFEAAEENELTFVAGSIIHVLDDSDPNWWKGRNQQEEGLFPSNFVTADLSVEPERTDINQKRKSVQFEDDSKQGEKTDIDTKDDNDIKFVEINEEKIDRLLHLLHEANPEDPSQDTLEMLQLEEHVNKMGPLIDTELERVDRKHAQLTQLSSDLVEAINLYHMLMREPDRTGLSINYVTNFNPHPTGMYGGLPTNPVYAAMPNIYNQGVPTSLPAPNSMSHMPLLHAIPDGALPQPAPSTLQPQSTNSNHHLSMTDGNFTSRPLSVVPIQYQNSNHSQQPNLVHSVTTLHQQQQQSSQQVPISSQQPNQNFLPQQQSSSQQNNSISIPTQQNNYGSSSEHYQMIHGPVSAADGNIMNTAGQHHPSSILISNHTGTMAPISQNSQQLGTINHPVTHTILRQNDSKTNVPIYRQHR